MKRERAARDRCQQGIMQQIMMQGLIVMAQLVATVAKSVYLFLNREV